MAGRSHPWLAALALVLVIGLSACESPPAAKLPELTFDHRPPVHLDVGWLEIAPEYEAPGRPPNIEHLMPVSPAQAIHQWARSRLKPVGRDGFAVVRIREASVKEVPLPTEDGLVGLFKTEPAERYDAVVEVVLEIRDARRMHIADVMTHAERSRSVPEGLTLNERDKILFEITEALARDVDQRMVPLIKTNLARWVVARPE